MKTLRPTLTALALILSYMLFAQQGINYKALIKDNGGNVVANDLIAIQFTILQGAGMVNVYQETHTPTTDDNGIIVVNIGEGSIDSGVFADIDWGADDHFLNVQIDTGGGFTDMGTTQFMAVPYAFNAANAATRINELSDGKTDESGTSLFLGNNSGENDDDTGNQNTGVGSNVLVANTSGNWNTGFGYASLLSTTTGSGNTGLGYAALRYNVDGIRNTAVGAQALRDNSTGIYNTAIGWDALYSNTMGSYNIALGSEALFSNLGGFYNTAIGYHALWSNLGENNTAIGHEALANNTDAINNTAIGWHALYLNILGWNNTANGFRSLASNVSGNFNIAVGSRALYNNQTGDENTAIGYEALKDNIDEDANTAVGSLALWKNVGYENTAVGRGALFSNTVGNNNIGIGSGAEVPDGTIDNQIVIGNNDHVSLTCMGAYNGTVGGTNRDVYVDDNGKIGYVASSARYKNNIVPMEKTDWVFKLRPVNYTHKNDELNLKQYGLIAEEVEKINPDLISYNKDGEVETVGYSKLITPMLKVIQEQQKLIDNLKDDNKALKSMYSNLDQRLKNLETSMNR